MNEQSTLWTLHGPDGREVSAQLRVLHDGRTEIRLTVAGEALYARTFVKGREATQYAADERVFWSHDMDLFPYNILLIPTPDGCPQCNGTHWVCEAHEQKPWPHCSGAGEPCPLCSPLRSGQPKAAGGSADTSPGHNHELRPSSGE